MEDVAGKIAFYHNLFLSCLALSVLCLVLAVILFFVLDIRSVLGYLTGRRAKKIIKELEGGRHPGEDSTMPLEPQGLYKGKFVVERELLLIHTEEVI